MTPPVHLLHQQWNRVSENGLGDLLIHAAIRHGVPPDYIIAVGSRETNLKNEEGDGGHGIGIIQIDIRFHEIARIAKETGLWSSDPAPLIDYGAKLLAADLEHCRKLWPELSPDQHLKITASAYNAGFGGAKLGVAHGNSDLHTAGHNYGVDVMKRRGIFHPWVSAHLANHPDLLKPTPPPAPYPGE